MHRARPVHGRETESNLVPGHVASHILLLDNVSKYVLAECIYGPRKEGVASYLRKALAAVIMAKKGED